MSGMNQQAQFQQFVQQRQAPGANGGGMGFQQGFDETVVPGAQQLVLPGTPGQTMQPTQPFQVDPAYGQQLQFAMQGAMPRVNGVRSNGLLSPGAMRVDPAYAGQPPMPAMMGRPAPIGRIRSR